MKTPIRKIRQYQRANAACFLGFLAIRGIVGRYHPTGTMAIFAAVGFALCFVGLLFTFALMVAAKRDEYQRNLLNQSILWGIGIIMTATFVWGSLEELLHIHSLPALFIFPAFLIVTAIAKFVIFRIHRPADE